MCSPAASEPEATVKGGTRSVSVLFAHPERNKRGHEHCAAGSQAWISCRSELTPT